MNIYNPVTEKGWVKVMFEQVSVNLYQLLDNLTFIYQSHNVVYGIRQYYDTLLRLLAPIELLNNSYSYANINSNMNVNPIMGISMNSNTNMNMNANMLNKNKSSINYSNLYINPVLPTEQLKFGVMNRELGIGQSFQNKLYKNQNMKFKKQFQYNFEKSIKQKQKKQKQKYLNFNLNEENLSKKIGQNQKPRQQEQSKQRQIQLNKDKGKEKDKDKDKDKDEPKMHKIQQKLKNKYKQNRQNIQSNNSQTIQKNKQDQYNNAQKQSQSSYNIKVKKIPKIKTPSVQSSLSEQNNIKRQNQERLQGKQKYIVKQPEQQQDLQDQEQQKLYAYSSPTKIHPYNAITANYYNRTCLTQEQQGKLCQWIQSKTKNGDAITKGQIMWKAKQMSKIRDFQASTGWCRRFLMRNERARIAVEMNRFIPSQYKSNHFDDYSEKLRESNLQYNKQKYKLLQEENEYMSRMKDESQSFEQIQQKTEKQLKQQIYEQEESNEPQQQNIKVFQQQRQAIKKRGKQRTREKEQNSKMKQKQKQMHLQQAVSRLQDAVRDHKSNVLYNGAGVQKNKEIRYYDKDVYTEKGRK